jgi:hypothetical protein
MKRLALILSLGLTLTPACDDPGQIDGLKPVFIAMSADSADIRSEDGELLRSVSPNDLTITLDEVMDVHTFDQLSALPEDPQANCLYCRGCVDNGNGTITCICREVSSFHCSLN